MQYKIVDTFNGWEKVGAYDSKEAAEIELEKVIAEFRKYNPGALCRKAVVPATDDWHHDGSGWVWS